MVFRHLPQCRQMTKDRIMNDKQKLKRIIEILQGEEITQEQLAEARDLARDLDLNLAPNLAVALDRALNVTVALDFVINRDRAVSLDLDLALSRAVYLLNTMPAND